jgi:hypothetical protein
LLCHRRLLVSSAHSASLQAPATAADAADAALSALPTLAQTEYEALLRGDNVKLALTILPAVPAAAALVKQGVMSEAAFAAVLGRAGYLTCPQTDLLPPGMPAARAAIEALEAKVLYTRGGRGQGGIIGLKMEEIAVLCCFFLF